MSVENRFAAGDDQPDGHDESLLIQEPRQLRGPLRDIERISEIIEIELRDDDSVGRLAARKLSELTPASFGYIPRKWRERWCTERRKAFCRELADGGHEVRIFSCKSREESVR